MKKKNLFLSALLAGAMFMGNAQLANAQFNLAANSDNVAKTFAATPTTLNTGNHMIMVGSKPLKVMC